MIGKEHFIEFCRLHKVISKNEELIRKAGLEIADFTDDYYALVACMMKIAFNKEQVGTIRWWLYEDVEKVIWLSPLITKKEKKIVVKTPEQLWDYLHKYCSHPKYDEGCDELQECESCGTILKPDIMPMGTSGRCCPECVTALQAEENAKCSG